MRHLRGCDRGPDQEPPRRRVHILECEVRSSRWRLRGWRPRCSRKLILFPVQSPNVTDTMHGVQADLMNRCLDKDQAIQYVSSVLDAAGVTRFNVLTDGPFGFPLGQREEVEQHVADGCYVYSGSGHDAEGSPTTS